MIPLLLLLALQDWPDFLGPRRDGASSQRGLIAPWPEGGPRVLWHVPLGIGYGSASVAAGRALVADREGDRIRLRAFDAVSGKALWTFSYVTDYEDRYGDNPGPRCCPVIDAERVYLYGPEGRLHALQAADGTAIWSRDTAKDFGVVPNFFGVGSTPLVEGDLLLAVVGGSPPGSPDIGSGETLPAGSALVAFDKRTGRTVYGAGDDLAAYGSPVAATLGGRRLVFVFARGGLLAFDPATGKVEFRFPWRAAAIQTVNASSPVVAGDLVVVSEAYSIGAACLRVKPGGYEVVWQDGRRRERALSCWWNTPLHADGHLYAASGMGDADLRCVALASGELRWTEPGLRQVSLVRADGLFIGLAEDGVLRLLDLSPRGCKVVSEASPRGPDGIPLLKGPARAAPSPAGGRLYVRGRDRLVCLELARPDPERAALEAAASAEIDPDSVEARSRRGDARFFLGRFADALADYERMVALDPALDAQHWRRGIARWYAGDFAGAARQFEIYHSFDDVDRENGIWRWLSQVRAHGKEKAREGLLKYAKDDREPFPAVYRLFSGGTTADEILKGIAAAEIGEEDRLSRNFYARLYIGLHAAVEGREEQARINLAEAAANPWPRKAGYGPRWMWHVARVHLDLLGP